MSRNVIFPKLYLIRHGATEWSETGQHTGNTDISLTDLGKKQAQLLSKQLQQYHFSKVFCSPSKRAQETCHICGFKPTLDPNLSEWNYGKYEGLTLQEIHQDNPNWDLFRDGAPLGESLSDIALRARHFIDHSLHADGNIAIFSSGHLMRVLASVWLEIPPLTGKHLYLSPSSISILGFEHANRVILSWNNTSHL